MYRELDGSERSIFRASNNTSEKLNLVLILRHYASVLCLLVTFLISMNVISLSETEVNIIRWTLLLIIGGMEVLGDSSQ